MLKFVETSKLSGMKRPKPLVPRVNGTVRLPALQPYLPPLSALDVLPLIQSPDWSKLVNPESTIASAAKPKFPTSVYQNVVLVAETPVAALNAPPIVPAV